jgi:alanine dehydrogenase
MMKVITTGDAAILVPNKEHENFTDTGRKIEANTVLNGNPTIIKGKRRGEPFDYKLFVTDKGEIIYINKTKQMNTTEVMLGADAAPSATIVKTPSESNLGMRPVLGTIIGAIAGYYIAKKKFPTKIKMFTVLGGVAGFAAGKYIQGNGMVMFKKSK